MAKFIVEFQYNVDRGQRQAYHEAHASYLYSLAERGVLLLGGPLVAENAGLLLYEVADREELERVLEQEPYIQAGVVAERRIREWRPGKGSWVTLLSQSAGQPSS
ncbi:MAG TPA: YciI family protein [Micromonosporaceae bacterium]|nr:YciI family protein [Micromonosporaceae bacterium]